MPKPSSIVSSAIAKHSPAVVLSILLPLIATPSEAACSSRSGNPQLHLVELFTSEGCSSCPPAEKWMKSLQGSDKFVGIEFHVDYFDTSAWRDPFANHAYTFLQETLANVTTHGFYATPQVWIDGQPWQDWPKLDPPKLLVTAPSILSVNIVSLSPLRVSFSLQNLAGQDRSGYDLFAAVTEDGLSSAVKGGENKGKQLSYDSVVRAFVGPLAAADTHVAFELPRDANLTHSAVVGFLRKKHNDAVVDVVRVRLNTCQKQ